MVFPILTIYFLVSRFGKECLGPYQFQLEILSNSLVKTFHLRFVVLMEKTPNLSSKLIVLEICKDLSTILYCMSNTIFSFRQFYNHY